jgi:hypothetical protein
MASTCAECGTQLTARADATYCSNACRQRAYRNRKLFDWEIARLKVNPKPIHNATAVTDKAEDTIRRLRHRIKELEAEFGQYRAECDANVAKLEAETQRQRALRDEERRRYQEGIEVHRAQSRGIFTRAEYDLIRSCLHPDSRASASDRKLANAFRSFNEAAILLLNAMDRPTTKRRRR